MLLGLVRDYATIVARLLQPLKVINALLHHLMVIVPWIVLVAVPLVHLLWLWLFLEEATSFLTSVCFFNFRGRWFVVVTGVVLLLLLEVICGCNIFALHAALEMSCASATLQERLRGDRGCGRLVSLRWLRGVSLRAFFTFHHRVMTRLLRGWCIASKVRIVATSARILLSAPGARRMITLSTVFTLI